ncbi:coiled-coil domain-containing protein 154 [Orycteropus afer afer]|uniref:Coiled-coil domain-containing protein 154 n=1 Tax=Orycteropus afer afer TaxID=1230840 RepID=A0A8B6ZQ49_ORYAF|nr:coiled-coil domain-containing protein 154 [Orycteropus afer afer]
MSACGGVWWLCRLLSFAPTTAARSQPTPLGHKLGVVCCAVGSVASTGTSGRDEGHSRPQRRLGLETVRASEHSLSPESPPSRKAMALRVRPFLGVSTVIPCGKGTGCEIGVCHPTTPSLRAPLPCSGRHSHAAQVAQAAEELCEREDRASSREGVLARGLGRPGRDQRPLHREPPAAVLADLDGTPSSEASRPSQLSSTLSLEDLELILGDDLASPGPPSLDEIPEKCEAGCLAPATSMSEQDTRKLWRQLEQRLANLQAEVACLRGHGDRCARATLNLLRELLRVRAQAQVQGAELRQLQRDMRQAGLGPQQEACEPSSTLSQTQMQALDKRLMEVCEALAQIRRKQALQDSERKSSDEELTARLNKLMGKLRQEGQDRKAACGALRRSQAEASQRVEHEVAKMQAQVTNLGEEMSLRFLKREAKLCGFLQKSFLALEKKMKAAEDARLQAEDGLWEALESRWQKLQGQNEERLLALHGQRQQEESRLLEQWQGLDRAVVQLTKFVRQNQVSLNRVLQARDAKGYVDKSQEGESAACVQENLEAVRLANELAQQETRSTLELLKEKNQALEVTTLELARQVKDLGDHFVALSWRLDLREQTLGLRLSEVKSGWEGTDSKPLEEAARWRQEAEVHLREVQEKVDSLPRQMESISDKCLQHKSDSDLKIVAEAKASSENGLLARFQNQIMRLENSLQDNKAIQNLRFNTETKLRAEEIAALRESVLRLWSEEGPWALTLGSRKVLMSLVRQRFFVKDAASSAVASVNQWGVYQAARWLQWKAALMSLARRPRARLEKPRGPEPGTRLPPLPLPQQ